MRMRHKKNLESRWALAAARHVSDPAALQGRWTEALCPDASALYLELGCGRGSFACTLAAKKQDSLILAAERVRDALIVGLERAEREGLPNLRFIAGDASRLSDWFAPMELNGLFIHFCDPWPARKHAKRRLVAGNFLELYRPLLAHGGFLRFKTDNQDLFRFALTELNRCRFSITEESFDLARSEENIETEYEQKFRAQGIPICALTAVPR